MAYLLDTNVWIDALRASNTQVVEHYRSIDASEVRLSTVVLGELLLGARKSGRRSTHQVQIIEKIAQSYLPVDVDQATAEAYADLRQRLEAAGQPIGPNDLWIAAQAVAHGLILVTANVSEFQRVPFLTQEDWRQPVDH